MERLRNAKKNAGQASGFVKNPFGNKRKNKANKKDTVLISWNSKEVFYERGSISLSLCKDSAIIRKQIENKQNRLRNVIPI